MADLEANFKQAAEDVKALTKSPTNEEKLQVYSLFKQGTIGDCNTERPGMFDMTGKAKWDAWNGIKGKSKDAAMTEYIAVVKELQGKYN